MGYPTTGTTGYDGTHPQGSVPSGSILVGSALWFPNLPSVAVEESGDSSWLTSPLGTAIYVPVQFGLYPADNLWPAGFAGAYCQIRYEANGTQPLPYNGYDGWPYPTWNSVAILTTFRWNPDVNPDLYDPWTQYPQVPQGTEVDGVLISHARHSVIPLQWVWGTTTPWPAGTFIVPTSPKIWMPAFSPGLSLPPSGATIDFRMTIVLAYDPHLAEPLPGFPLRFHLPDLPVVITQWPTPTHSGTVTAGPGGGAAPAFPPLINPVALP